LLGVTLHLEGNAVALVANQTRDAFVVGEAIDEGAKTHALYGSEDSQVAAKHWRKDGEFNPIREVMVARSGEGIKPSLTQ